MKTARTNPSPQRRNFRGAGPERGSRRKLRERTQDQNCANEPKAVSSAISAGRGESRALIGLIGLIRLIGPIGPIGLRRYRPDETGFGAATKTARTNPRPKLRERTRDQNCAKEPKIRIARTNPRPKLREGTQDQNRANEPETKTARTLSCSVSVLVAVVPAAESGTPGRPSAGRRCVCPTHGRSVRCRVASSTDKMI
jgi:hypothetical protein